jgi:hypothetical protein
LDHQEITMRKVLVVFAIFWSAAAMSAETESFDKTKPGDLPVGWIAGVTGFGSPVWAVVADPGAPTPPNVLKQSGSGTYPWAVRKDASIADGYVEARFKAISGKEDQAGGVVWRWRDGRTYYVARANANENNVSLYYTTLGIRSTIRYVDAPVPRNVWHTLRAEFSGKKIRILLNGKLLIEAEDDHIAQPGAIGVWTKADSVTLFDDVTYGVK